MATRAQVPQIAPAPARLNIGWILAVVALLAVIAFGGYAYATQHWEGDIVTGMRDVGIAGGAPWGLYVVVAIYLMGISFAGVTVAVLVRLLNLEFLRPVARLAGLLTLAAVVVGGLAIMADWGQPLRGLINFLRYARPMSPYFGTFSMAISVYFAATFVFLFLEGRRDAAILARRPSALRWLHRILAAGYGDTEEEQRRHERASFWLALGMLPVLMAATSMLGLVFGLQTGRAGWSSALLAPEFLVLAGASGVALTVVVAAAARRAVGERAGITVRAFAWLNTLLWILAAVYLYFMVADVLTGLYQARDDEARVTRALLSGTYAPLFWVTVGLLGIAVIIGAGQTIARRTSLPLTVVAALMVAVGAFLKRYLIVVPSLTHGSLLPYASGSYSPTWVEYGVALGLFALGALIYILLVRVYPATQLEENR